MINVDTYAYLAQQYGYPGGGYSGKKSSRKHSRQVVVRQETETQVEAAHAFDEEEAVNTTLSKRVGYDGNGQPTEVEDWGNAFISTYFGIDDWARDSAYVRTASDGKKKFKYHYHRQPAEEGPGAGQYIYFWDSCFYEDHEVSLRPPS